MTMGERVLIYGSRTWTNDAPIYDVVMALPPDAVVIVGGAAGADHIAWMVARGRGMETKTFYADWKTYGRAAGPIRNQQMIDEGQPTRAIGFRSAGESRGTDDMTRRLVAAGIPHKIVHAAPSTPPASLGGPALRERGSRG